MPPSPMLHGTRRLATTRPCRSKKAPTRNRETRSPKLRLSGFQSAACKECGISNPCATDPRKDANASRPNTQHHNPILHRSPVGVRHKYARTTTHSMASTASVALVVISVGEAIKAMLGRVDSANAAHRGCLWQPLASYEKIKCNPSPRTLLLPMSPTVQTLLALHVPWPFV